MFRSDDPFDDGSGEAAPQLCADPFAEVLLPFPPSTSDCRCGGGWCALHGTFHFSRVEELDELDRRAMLQSGTGGGRRVLRKKMKEE